MVYQVETAAEVSRAPLFAQPGLDWFAARSWGGRSVPDWLSPGDVAFAQFL